MEVIYVLAFFAAVCVAFLFGRLIRLMHVNAGGMEVPGPEALPLIGNMFDVSLRGLHLSVSRMAELYGPIFRIKLLGRNIVIINDADIERKAFASTEYRDIFNDRVDSFVGKYICFGYSDIAFANYNRKTNIKRKLFHRSLKFYGDGIPHFNKMNKDELLDFLKTLRLTNQCNFDMRALISKSLANTLARLLIGASPTQHDCEGIMELADSGGFFISGMGFIYDFFPMIRYLPGFFRNRYRKFIDSRDQLLDKFYYPVKDIVDDTLGEKEGFVKNLMKLQKEINQNAGTDYITENDIKGIIMDVIGASQESTATLIINAFAIMLTHPHVAKKIQDEIDESVGPSRLPNEADKPHMHYTIATVYEMLRYTSTVALSLPHRSSKDMTFEGFYIAKDSVLLANHWYIHHDPTFWHEPWAFNPERFLDDAGKLLPLEDKMRRNVLAFSTGHRECPGENFGKSRIFFYLTAVLQSFDIIPSLDGRIPDTDPRNYDLRGANVQVEPFLCRAILREVAM